MTLDRRASAIRPGRGVAGLLAAVALFLGALELAYRPFRLAPVGADPARSIATVMSKEQQRLIALAFAVSASASSSARRCR